jgi:hypothetical protein
MTSSSVNFSLSGFFNQTAVFVSNQANNLINSMNNAMNTLADTAVESFVVYQIDSVLAEIKANPNVVYNTHKFEQLAEIIMTFMSSKHTLRKDHSYQMSLFSQMEKDYKLLESGNYSLSIQISFIILADLAMKLHFNTQNPNLSTLVQSEICVVKEIYCSNHYKQKILSFLRNFLKIMVALPLLGVPLLSNQYHRFFNSDADNLVRTLNQVKDNYMIIKTERHEEHTKVFL